MCLRIKERFSSKEDAVKFMKKPLIAEKDIRVYKVLNRFNMAIYRHFQYEKGYCYTETESFSYIAKEPLFSGIYIEIYTGFHSCKDIKSAKSHIGSIHHRIVTMYIPKGAKYFEGEDGEYVSNKIVWY